MAGQLGRSKASALILILVLPFAIGVFGIPMRYSAAASVALAVAQLLPMGAAASLLISLAWRYGDEDRRRIAVAGLFLILPWALLTLMPGYGPPFASSLAMNHVRFIILFVSTAFLGAGLLLVKRPLEDGKAGDRLLAPLGQASGLLATLIQLVWASILIGWTMSEAHKPTTYLPMYGTPLGNASDVLLFFAEVMTYAATACYALSFARQGWLGPRKAGIMTAVAVIAVGGLVVRGLQYPDLPENWYTMPGMIVGIPAIPWIMPYLLGVCSLYHAAADRADSA